MGVPRTTKQSARGPAPAGVLRDDTMSWRITRQQRQREATIDRLLSCSRFVLQRDGHAMFTLRAVAAHAGVRLSGLQHYFESKDHLLTETVRHFTETDFKRYQDYAGRDGDDPVAGLTRILDHAFDVVADPVETGLILEIWALSRHSSEILGIWRDRFREYFDIIAGLVQAINPALEPMRARAIAEVCVGNLEGIVVTSLTMADLRSDRSAIRATILEGWRSMWLNSK